MTQMNELFLGNNENKLPTPWLNFLNSFNESYPNHRNWSDRFYNGLLYDRLSSKYKVQWMFHYGRSDAKLVFKSEKHKNIFLMRWS